MSWFSNLYQRNRHTLSKIAPIVGAIAAPFTGGLSVVGAMAFTVANNIRNDKEDADVQQQRIDQQNAAIKKQQQQQQEQQQLYAQQQQLQQQQYIQQQINERILPLNNVTQSTQNSVLPTSYPAASKITGNWLDPFYRIGFNDDELIFVGLVIAVIVIVKVVE